MARASATLGRGPLVVAARLVDIALIAVVAMGLASVVVGRLLPLVGHPVYVVAGPSMEPAIGVGSAVILDGVSSRDLAVGDVVSLRSGPGRAIFTHRIIRLLERDGEPWIETQGDANDAPDPAITPASAVIGRVALSVPGAGYLIALLSTVPGVVLLLSTGTLLLVAGWWLEGVWLERLLLQRRPTIRETALAPRRQRSRSRSRRSRCGPVAAGR